MVARKFHCSKEELERIYGELGSTRKVAGMLGVSKKLVTVYLKKFGIPVKQPNRTTTDQMIALCRVAANGGTAREAAELTGMHFDTILRLGRKHGFKFRDPFHKGFTVTHNGYTQVWMPKHPDCDAKGYVREHRRVAAETLKKALEPGEIVHHIDGNKQNNDPSNLEVMSLSEHTKLHRAEQLKI